MISFLYGMANKNCFYWGSGSAGGRVIEARQCFSGMQQRVFGCFLWPMRVQFCQICKA